MAITAKAIGFVGLGDQGLPMAEAIAEAGYSLAVWARRPETLTKLERAMYRVQSSPRALANACDIVCLCLRDDADIDELLDNGLRDGLRAGSILVNHGTGDPAVSKKLAFELHQRGVAYLDAPVSGGRPGAIDRTLTTMVGGERSAFLEAEPLFDTFSRKVAYFGAAGSGQMAKLLNNAMTLSNLRNAVDVFTLAGALGMDLPMLQEVLLVSSGSSAILRALGSSITDDTALQFQRLMYKDIEHFTDAMTLCGLDSSALRSRATGGIDGLPRLTRALKI